MNNQSIEPNLPREIAAETAIVAFDPLKKQWLTSEQAQSRPSIAIPSLDGRLIFDSPSLAAVADDFGHII